MGKDWVQILYLCLVYHIFDLYMGEYKQESSVKAHALLFYSAFKNNVYLGNYWQLVCLHILHTIEILFLLYYVLQDM